MGFEKEVRQKGLQWLAKAENQNEKPYPYWNKWPGFAQALASAFRDLCAYAGMRIRGGEVDHFLSQQNHRTRAYEWDNFRYALGKINRRKKPHHDGLILDPFDVQEGWFELDLATMQVTSTDLVPQDKRASADLTLNLLKLGSGDDMKRWRWSVYDLFRNGTCALGYLEKEAPLIWDAVRKAIEEVPPHLTQRQGWKQFYEGQITLGELGRVDEEMSQALEALLPPVPKYSEK